MTERPAAFATIAAHARRTNLARARNIAAAFETAATGGLDRAGWSAAERAAHQLAGSAGTFGFSGVSERALVLEHFLHDVITSGAVTSGTIPPERLAQARAWLAELTDQLAGEPDTDCGG
ncbi:MAG: Hpt domain-containing protein [Microlunatus sp.]|nr:Hpt domain-containing protein [Microlunatus sp.]MDN5771230.1 Hpt domain-containing protein [Microlunatus sp.]MDN5803255.1 Hpt domain-containing protein [Microlunatus sp.]